MKDKIYYGSLALVCAVITYFMLKDIMRKPDYTVTRAMIEKAEMEAIFGTITSSWMTRTKNKVYKVAFLGEFRH